MFLEGEKVGRERQSEEEAKVQRTRGDACRRPGKPKCDLCIQLTREQTQDAALMTWPQTHTHTDVEKIITLN